MLLYGVYSIYRPVPPNLHPFSFTTMRHKTALVTFASVTIALFLAAIPQSSNAYVLEGPSWASGATVVFQLGLGNAGRTLIDGNTSWNTAAAPALNNWDQNIQRVQITSVNGTSSVSSGDGVNSIVFSATVFGQSFGANTLAVTYYRYSGSRMSEADILFNQNQSFDSYRGSLRFGAGGWAIGDIRRVLVHELGHALGLGHPDQAGQHVDAIMNAVISNRETVSSDDISGGQSLYGAPGQSPTPTPTPSATPTPTPTPSPTATPTPTPSATPTPTPQGTPAVSVTVSPTTVHYNGSATFKITASVRPGSTVTVNYAMGGTAIRGNHYSLSGIYGKATIPAGANSATVTLTVIKSVQSSKIATMTLSSGSGYTLSSPTSASVTIVK